MPIKRLLIPNPLHSLYLPNFSKSHLYLLSQGMILHPTYMSINKTWGPICRVWPKAIYFSPTLLLSLHCLPRLLLEPLLPPYYLLSTWRPVGSFKNVNQVMSLSCFILVYSKTQISCYSSPYLLPGRVYCYISCVHKAPGPREAPKKYQASSCLKNFPCSLCLETLFPPFSPGNFWILTRQSARGAARV